MNFIDRSVLSAIIKQLDNNLILILTGARQVGKTSLLRMLTVYLDKHYPGSKILYLNLEKEDLIVKLSDYQNFLNYLFAQGVDLNKKTFILLDEFQRLPRPTKLLKLIYDEHPALKIIATGSSSLDIYRKMREESMAGRKRFFYVYPLNFDEFLNFRYSQLRPVWKNIIDKDIDPSIFIPEFTLPFGEFAVWGGYPRISLIADREERQKELEEIYNSYIQRDIIGLLQLKDTVGYNKLVNLLASQIGNLFSVNEISNTLNIARSTVESYLFVLENTFIIKQLPPYYTNKRKEIAKMPKIFFMDTGLRNFAQKNFAEFDLRIDGGQLAENAVFLELLKNLKVGHNLYFWRTSQGTEVDFVLTNSQSNPGQNAVPIEVKYRSVKKPVIPSGIKSFINMYHSKYGFVLTKDFSAATKYNGAKIIFLPMFLAAKIFMIVE